MVTGVPMLPCAGRNPVPAGAGKLTVKAIPVLVPSGELTVTRTGPGDGKKGIEALRWLLSVICREGEATPLNVTDLASRKPLPRRATLVPSAPLLGEIPVMTGARIRKDVVDETAPARFAIVTAPVVAPLGTSARMVVSFKIVNAGESTL